MYSFSDCARSSSRPRFQPRPIALIAFHMPLLAAWTRRAGESNAFAFGALLLPGAFAYRIVQLAGAAAGGTRALVRRRSVFHDDEFTEVMFTPRAHAPA